MIHVATFEILGGQEVVAGFAVVRTYRVDCQDKSDLDCLVAQLKLSYCLN
jgi:hypothetical protein